MIEIIGMKFNF